MGLSSIRTSYDNFNVYQAQLQRNRFMHTF
jgi:hypothetical protein